MERVRVECPAAWTDCLACAGGRALARKAAIYQRGKGETCAMFAGDDLLAVAYLVPDDDGRLEFCLSLRPAARPHMLELCRFAHSTLKAAAENGAVVICHVAEGNQTGRRMALAVGLRPIDGTLWRFEG